MIKCIIFDLGKVIVAFDLRRGYAALERHCGYAVEEIPKRIGSTDLVERFEMGQVSSEEFVKRLSGILGLRVDYRQFCDLWSSIFLPDPLVPETLLECLKQRYRLLLLSNTNAIHFSMVREKYPILRHFHDLILSFEVGAMKPDPRIYQEAIQRSGCRPQECLFIDDIPLYVEAGKRAGMDAVQFQSVERLEGDLQSRGVECGGWR